mmetsp:Transcript_11333/g.38753  ORF Transcript_11333/g.38753 Transcript_11333/m.38753 type:complete len:271 (+) Transcript_11333:216-1028(+)
MARWEEEQVKLEQAIVKDDVGLTFDPETFAGLERVAGADISCSLERKEEAVASLVVMEFPSMKVLYEKRKSVRIDLPYISGFLAFRESPPLVQMIEEIRADKPALLPQIVLIDGNGILHPRGCGVASHIGVVTDIPTIGVAKNLICFDGLNRDAVKHKAREELVNQGDYFDLVGSSGKVHGAALMGRKDRKQATCNPIFVSIGHRTSLKTAVRLVSGCCTSSRLPEPIRQVDVLVNLRRGLRDEEADLRSREAVKPLGRQLPEAPCLDLT